MTEQRRYPNAPLTEALIDIRVSPFELNQLGKLEKRFSDTEFGYQLSHHIDTTSAELNFGQKVSASASQTTIGFAYISQNSNQLFQARLDGFTMNRMAPYETWESFRDEAQRLWSIYRETLPELKVVRIALRYINRFDIPQEGIELREYLRTFPEISPALPQILAGAFMQIRIPQLDIHGMLVLNEAIAPPPKPGTFSILFDIDLFSENIESNDEVYLWEFFERLRVRKNEIFEACITDKLREVIS